VKQLSKRESCSTEQDNRKNIVGEGDARMGKDMYLLQYKSHGDYNFSVTLKEWMLREGAARTNLFFIFFFERTILGVEG